MSINTMKLALEALENASPAAWASRVDSDTMKSIWRKHAEALEGLQKLLAELDNAACKSVQKRLEAQQPATGEPVWCVATGERVNGEETYTHHDAYVPLADCFTLYTHQAPSVPATAEPVAWLDEMLADTREVFDANGSETPQAVRDVIEYVASWVTVYREKNHPAPSVPDGLQWFTVAEHGLPEVGEVVVGGLWYTDPWLKPECATSFMWGQCRVVDTKHRDFKDGKQWLTFGPSHNQITHWARLNPPSMLAANTHPAPSVPNDHQIAALVNKVRDIARTFHDHQSLRERIAIELVPALKVTQEVKSNAERWRHAIADGENQSMNFLDIFDDWGGDGDFVEAFDAAMLAAKERP